MEIDKVGIREIEHMVLWFNIREKHIKSIQLRDIENQYSYWAA